MEDSGWVNVQMGNNIALYDSASVMQVRRIGKVVHMRGTLKNLASFQEHASFLIIPAGFRPSKSETRKLPATGTLSYTLWIKANGVCTMSAGVNDTNGNYTFPPGSLFDVAATWFLD